MLTAEVLILGHGPAQTVLSPKRTTVSAYDVRIRRMKHNLAGDTNKILQHAGNWPCVEGKKGKAEAVTNSFNLIVDGPKPPFHSCAHRSLGKRSCHPTIRHWRTTLCRYPRRVVDPLASLPMKPGWINTFKLRNREIGWNNTSFNNEAFGANGVQSGRTSFHTKCFHSGEETTKVMKGVPQVVRRSYSCLYP